MAVSLAEREVVDGRNILDMLSYPYGYVYIVLKNETTGMFQSCKWSDKGYMFPASSKQGVRSTPQCLGIK